MRKQHVKILRYTRPWNNFLRTCFNYQVEDKPSFDSPLTGHLMIVTRGEVLIQWFGGDEN